eukprot:SAG22_NODE_490_length_9834_cov_7.723780_6_plen_141_part_00
MLPYILTAHPVLSYLHLLLEKIGSQQTNSCGRRSWPGSTRDVLVAAVNPATGLAPHSCQYSGAPLASCHGLHSCDFEDDAWRVARNWGLDYHWTAADPRQIALSNTILGFFATEKNGGGGGGGGGQCRAQVRAMGGDFMP